MADMVVVRKEGLYCVPGQFYIDPWRPVERAIITHAHADHARVGHRHYLCAAPGEQVLRARMGAVSIQALAYGDTIEHHGVQVSLHPAGHVLGSAQVRMQYGGEVWVASGDYKLQPDPTCAPFEPVRCDTFITESTFGLPIYRWQAPQEIYDDINQWWRRNAAEGRTSVLFCYAFGKAQRILAGLDATIGPIICHGAAQALTQVYRECGVALPATVMVDEVTDKAALKTALVIAPPSAAGSPWMKRFGDYSDAFASGWMLLRGARRRRGVDRGFVLSDHADWPGLMQAIRATQAERIIVTHGSIHVMVRWLQQNGWQAGGFETEYGDDEADDNAPGASTAAEDVTHA
ncbi:ligase-associated DNA damage response exonuclease [Janthinobacterium lividum]|uniref:Ligase-associated DNA damage response exonuclease n=1 Tax=Janthinobacterium lividum TaxID=29581 RepID=A0ABU0XZL6_9BURK|nr:ligase-associated DNA damage response exonuclease [Janthinobacterium lividum]MDQ4629039.1 ligase-associated DNA damage response exonuclease [Janthinobacterium lividum]MDQ4677437.1 ligase-associated DNA damage response exonuclease [Janthinobacterium lividum]MDQ4687997.1 ligase-associated DNA damage response exonuclease [Janthinobacterium lividum]